MQLNIVFYLHFASFATLFNKKLSYRRGTARCVLSVEICQFQRNSAETTYSTSPGQIDGMKLEI